MGRTTPKTEVDSDYRYNGGEGNHNHCSDEVSTEHWDDNRRRRHQIDEHLGKIVIDNGGHTRKKTVSVTSMEIEKVIL